MFILSSVRVAPGVRSALVAACVLTLCATDVAMAQGVASLPSVVVTATRQPVQMSALLADVSVIDREEIEKTGQGSVADLLARQPGVQAAGNGGAGTATSFYVRGANADQTKVLVDGVPINSIDPSGSPLRLISLADVERIEILRGPAAALYGSDALAGVIQVFTKRGTRGLKVDGFVGAGSHNTVNTQVGVSGGDEHWRFRVNGSRETSDGFSSAINATNRDADDDSYRNSTGSASLSFLPVKGHEVGLSFRRNNGVVRFDDFTASGDYDNRSRFETEQWYVFTKNRFLPVWESKLQYGESSDDQTTFGWDSWSGPGAETIDRLASRTKHLNWQNDVTLPLGVALLAVERTEQQASPGESFTAKPATSNNSVVGGWTASLREHDWQINLRHDAHSAYGDENTYGLAYGYRLSDEWRARVSYGTSFKAPSVYQLYATYYGVGNPNLKPEEGRNREAALTWARGGQHASLTYYLNKVGNLIDFDSITYSYANVSRARLEGLTFEYGREFAGWDLRATYDWLNATSESTGKRLGRRARNKALVSASRDWGAYNTGIELVGVDKRFDNNAEQKKLGGYALLNLTGSYALTAQWRLEGRVDNLFDKTYENALGYATPGVNAFIGIRYTPK